ncbi:MAG: RHS repeat-associated core domain-containing protein, partial [Christensenellales bacterium]
KVVAVNYNGNYYYYLRNAQSDIVKLIDKTGATVVEYRYDSWGKLLSTSGSLASTLGKNNPFRYRGYVYDEETGFYYLQSRYYNPEVGRFISSDVLLSTGQGVLGHNAYAYCLNNPVNMSDNCGSYAEAIKPLDGAGGGSLGIGIGIGSLILAIISAITNITTSKPKVKTEKEQAYFTTNPMDFNPVGLTRTMYPGTKNGAIIKWCDPTNGATVFEWNEDLKHGSHYHVFMPNLNGLHDGTHYYPGQRVPEPWNSLYF